MNLKHLALFLLLSLVPAAAVSGQKLPKPKVKLVGTSSHEVNGRRYTGYELEVVNRDKYSNDLFVPSPALPPCGKNANSSRTWVNIYNEMGVRIYGHCAINASGALVSIKFSVLEGTPKPKKVFIDMVDRADRKISRSNTVKIQ